MALGIKGGDSQIGNLKAAPGVNPGALLFGFVKPSDMSNQSRNPICNQGNMTIFAR